MTNQPSLLNIKFLCNASHYANEMKWECSLMLTVSNNVDVFTNKDVLWY